jgi:hypothetical protein
LGRLKSLQKSTVRLGLTSSSPIKNGKRNVAAAPQFVQQGFIHGQYAGVGSAPGDQEDSGGGGRS